MIRYKMSIIIISLSLCCVSFGAAYSGGTGEPNNPYKINTAADWQTLMATSADWGKCFVLVADVNLAGVTVAPVGNSTVNFTGFFDGGGNSIFNAIIIQPYSNYVGLFGYVNTAQIRNLMVKDVNIVGQGSAGGLVGYNYGGTVTGCYATGTISGSMDVGGLVGSNYGGSITGCCATCMVSVSSPNVGGLVGNNNGSIINCCATGAVSGLTICVGGLAGYNNGTIKGSYAAGIVNGTSSVGGLVGSSSNSIYNCFWDTQSSGRNNGVGSGNVTGLTGKTTAEMKQLSTFRDGGWDIADANGADADWIIGPDGQDYPKNIYFVYSSPATFSGDGSEQNPYQIQTAADFALLGQCSSTWGRYIILTTDIDLDGVALRPIGNSVIRFTGSFDGQGFAIRNAKINMPNKDYVGLFGGIGEGGTVKNLAVEDANISGKKFVGVLCGFNYGTISDCHTTGAADANSLGYAGGIAGSNGHLSYIINCYSTANVRGRGASIGGLAGINGGCATISASYASGTVSDSDANSFGTCAGGLSGSNLGAILNCYASGDIYASASNISSSNNNVGGLVGANGYGGTILGSYATGDVFCNSDSVTARLCAGGLVGLKSYGDVNDCYAAGTVAGDTSTGSDYYIGGLMGLTADGGVRRCYSRTVISANGSIETGYCVGGLTGLNIGGDIFGCFWDTKTSGKTSSAAGRGLSTPQMKTAAAYQNADWGGNWVIWAGKDYPRLVWETTPGSPIGAISAVPLFGSGTPDDPYQIWTVEDFINLNRYASVLDAQIDLMDDLDFAGVAIDPIGDLGVFTGYFNGNGFTIRNVNINKPASSYVGLFGHVGAGGMISDLKIEAANITGGDYVGGLIGRNGTYISSNPFVRNGGTVSQCFADGNVSGFYCTGGLIGSSEDGIIDKCSSVGTVSAWDPNSFNTGGLVGYQLAGSVTSSYSKSNVSGGKNVGGFGGSISGSNYDLSPLITNCYATGTVNGYYYIGGLMGITPGSPSSSIRNCFSAGKVTGTYYYTTGNLAGRPRATGGLAGGGSSSYITACFWDVNSSGQTIPIGDFPYGIGGKTTEQMKSISTYGGWDFTTIWSICEGTNYPRLRWSIPAYDFVCPDGVSFGDYSYLAARWLDTGCAGTNNCGGADMDLSGTVDWQDLSVFCQRWLDGV